MNLITIWNRQEGLKDWAERRLVFVDPKNGVKLEDSNTGDENGENNNLELENLKKELAEAKKAMLEEEKKQEKEM